MWDKKGYELITKDFNNPLELEKAYDIDSYESLRMSYVQQIPELSNFFGLDEDGPYSEFLNKGLRSLRRGFYKLCGLPFYKETIEPHTFAADVYYFNPDHNFNTLIKYRANVGPMINVHFDYAPLQNTIQYTNVNQVPILNRFIEERSTIGWPGNHYYEPKENFFTTLFNANKMFFVHESVYDPAFLDTVPKPKKITWSFIDY